MASEDVRVGIVGYGLAGREFHGRLLGATRGAAVAAIVTRDPSRRSQAGADHPGAGCFDDVREMLAVGIDLAVIATPNVVHEAAASACLDAGVAVVVDKPIAPTADTAQRIVEHARDLDVPLTVFQNRRWDSDQLTLRRLREEGILGDVLRYESRFERWRPELERG